MNPCIKATAVFLTISLTAFLAHAQSSTTAYSVKGVVADSLSQQPLELVTAVLKDSGNKPVKSVLTSDKGTFLFEVRTSGKYMLTLVSVGYKKKEVSFSVDKQNVDLGKLLLVSESKQLNEVTVTADRPLIKQEVDRVSYDVQADPENKIQSALDMMRKVPLITIDAEDNIKLKGEGNYKILINGRPSSMMSKDPKEVLKSLPANTITKIEVITNPPAKYDSEGLAGIINIITNKKIDNGYNASLGTRYNSIWGPSANTSLTFKQGKFGFSGYGGGSLHRAPSRNFSNYRIGISPIQSYLNQFGENRDRGGYNYGGGEFSFEIDTLNLITASFGLNTWNSDRTSTQNAQSFDRVGGTLNQSYLLENNAEMGWRGSDVGVNYQLGFKRNKEQLLTASYKYNYSNDDQESKIIAAERFNYVGRDYMQLNESGSHEQTIQLDYVHPVKKIDIEGGFKAILRDNFSESEYRMRDISNGNFEEDTDRSNLFNYNQNVLGFYNSYNLKLKDWGVKAGLRLERTLINVDFTSSQMKLKDSYNNFIPSISIQRKLKNMSSLNFGYTQRIRRPSIWELNPFIDQSDPKFIYQGNKDLEPVLNHNFDLSFSTFKKGSINLGLNYSFANNTIEYFGVLGADSITRTTFRNIGKNKKLGFNSGVNYNLTKKLSVNLNGALSYVWITGFLNNNQYENEGLQGNIYAYAGYSFENNWRLSVNGGYYSGWLTLQGKSNPYIYSSASVTKEFFNKKASASVGVNNPFQKFRNWKNDQNTPEFIQSSRYQNYYRSFNGSFTYRIGKLQNGIKKNKRGINNDDVQGKSGGGGQ